MIIRHTFFALLISVIISNAQDIKIENGILINSYKNNLNLDIMNLQTPSYFSSIGIDYLQKRNYYLSSQIGFLRLNGKEKFNNGIEEIKISEKANYIHLNTTFRYLLSQKKNWELFVGGGPYVNFLLGNKNFMSSIYKNFYKYNSVHFGATPELGLYTREINKFKIGLVSKYLFNLTPSVKTEGVKLNNSTYVVNIALNYNLK